MNRILVTLYCLIFCLSLTGCQNLPEDSKDEITIENRGQFPDFMVGTWRAEDKSGWEFVFEPDGTISSAVIALCKVRLKPDQVTTVPLKKGGKSVYEAGEWIVDYDAGSRDLTVKITVKNFSAIIEEAKVTGKVTDIFVGTITEDGKFWHAIWTSYRKLAASTPKHPQVDLTKRDEESIPKNLTFGKITEE